MSKVCVGMAQAPFCGSSCYNRKVDLPGLSIETSVNGGMSFPSFWVTINGRDYGANSIEEMEQMIESAIKKSIGDDAYVMYTHYTQKTSKTVDPWNRWRE